MGRFSVAALNAMLTQLASVVTHLALFDAGTAITGVTGTASTDVFAKTGHGLTNGTLVILTEMTGGTGLEAGDAGNANEAARPYFVINANANDFQLSRTSGGSAFNFTTDVSAVTVTPLVEISGGSPAYARKAVAWNSVTEATVDDSTNGAVFDIPAGATVDYVGGFTASTGGTLETLDKVTSEAFAAQGTYEVTDADMSLQGV